MPEGVATKTIGGKGVPERTFRIYEFFYFFILDLMDQVVFDKTGKFVSELFTGENPNIGTVYRSEGEGCVREAAMAVFGDKNLSVGLALEQLVHIPKNSNAPIVSVVICPCETNQPDKLADGIGIVLAFKSSESARVVLSRVQWAVNRLEQLEKSMVEKETAPPTQADCTGCAHRHYVEAHPRGTSSNGWGCLLSGGHAINRCEEYKTCESPTSE
jgi:hypothetical protein